MESGGWREKSMSICNLRIFSPKSSHFPDAFAIVPDLRANVWRAFPFWDLFGNWPWTSHVPEVSAALWEAFLVWLGVFFNVPQIALHGSHVVCYLAFYRHKPLERGKCPYQPTPSRKEQASGTSNSGCWGTNLKPFLGHQKLPPITLIHLLSLLFFFFHWLHWVFLVTLCSSLQLMGSRAHSSVVVACRLSCPAACGILAPWSGVEPTSPALEGEFLTTGPPGKSLIYLLWQDR